MEADRGADFVLDRRDGFAGRDASQKIGHIGRVVAVGLLDYHRVAHQRFSFRPACFNMLFSVPGARSSDDGNASSFGPMLVLLVRLWSQPETIRPFRSAGSPRELSAARVPSAAGRNLSTKRSG